MWKETLKWIATSFIVIGAVSVSIAVEFSSAAWPYFLFLTGHIVWSAFAFIMKERAFLWLNIGMLPLDVYAIYIRI